MGRDKETALEATEEAFGYTFRDPALLREALTHRSRANEARRDIPDNERLEFLGDAVLGLAAARLLFETFPGEREGDLSRRRASLVGEEWLAAAARRLGLPAALRLGRGEERTGGREKPSLLAGALEALLGAAFLDGGWAAAERAARRVLGDPCAADVVRPDSKTLLQEACQERFRITPVYRLLSRTGPPHRPRFRVAACLGKRSLAEGEGASKKEAQQAAAAAALEVVEHGDAAGEPREPEP